MCVGSSVGTLPESDEPVDRQVYELLLRSVGPTDLNTIDSCGLPETKEEARIVASQETL